MTGQRYIPKGNTEADIEDSVEVARLAMELAYELVMKKGVWASIGEVLTIAAPYAQIIEMRLWEQRQQSQ